VSLIDLTELISAVSVVLIVPVSEDDFIVRMAGADVSVTDREPVSARVDVDEIALDSVTDSEPVSEALISLNCEVFSDVERLPESDADKYDIDVDASVAEIAPESELDRVTEMARSSEIDRVPVSLLLSVTNIVLDSTDERTPESVTDVLSALEVCSVAESVPVSEANFS
jgi:hypothetical protein